MRCEFEAHCGLGPCDILLNCCDFRHMSKETRIKVDAKYKKDKEWLVKHKQKGN